MIRRLDRPTGALVLLGVIAAVLLCLTAPSRPQIVTDSALYIDFSPIVPAGYPLFVALVGLAALVPVQLVFFSACATLLAITVQRLFGHLLLSLAVLAAMFVNPQVIDFERSVVSEAAFLPIDMIALASLLAYAARGRAKMAIFCAIVVGVGVTLRPISYPMILAVLAVVLLRERGNRRRGLLLAVAGLIAWTGVVGGEKAYSRWRHGDQLTSLTGLHLYAKGSLLDVPPIDRTGLSDVERRLADASETRYAPVRALLTRSRESVAYQALLAYYEICIQRDCTKRLREQSGMPDAAFNDAMLHVGWLRVKENPLGYLRLAADEYRSLWVLSSRTYPSRAPRFDSYIASARPLPLEQEINSSLMAPTSPSRVALVVRPAYMAAGILTAAIVLAFGWLLIVMRRRDPAMLSAFGCALSVEMVFAFTSFAGVGDGRYTMGLWPNTVLGLLLGAAVVSQIVIGRKRRGKE